MSHSLSALCIGAATIALLPVAQTTASEESSSLEEIVVTAQRKTERLQDVPIAVNAATARTLEEEGISGIDMSTFSLLVPGFTGATVNSRGIFFLRGVGSTASFPSSEPSVATYVDGVYIASNSATLSSFNNIERIEILKGPQGTLFGRNATGGVIQIITKDPGLDRTSLSGKLGYGNYDSYLASLYVSTPLTSTVALNLAAQADGRAEGFGRNLILNRDTNLNRSKSVRSKLLFAPSETLRIILSGDYTDFFNNAERVHPAGAPNVDNSIDPITNGFDNYLNRVQFFNNEQGGGSVNINYDMGFARVITITAYRNVKGHKIIDADGGSRPFAFADIKENQHNLSQELQLVSPDNSKIDWLLGSYYFSGTGEWGPPGQIVTGQLLGAALYQLSQSYQDTQSISGFGQATAEVLAKTKLTAGLRLTNDKERVYSLVSTALSAGVPYNNRKSDDNWTWRLALDHAFSQDIHSYVSYNRGIKSGGFSLGVSQPGFNPENLDAYELGLKSELLDEKLRFNSALFYYDYKNIQLVQNVGATTPVVNAAAAEIAGIDIDFNYVVTRNLVINGGLNAMTTRYKKYPNAVGFKPNGARFNFDASGRKLQFASPFQGVIGARYGIPTSGGEFSLSADGTYSAGYYYNATNQFKQRPYTLVNATLIWVSPGQTYSADLWIKNLTDRYYYSVGSETSFGYLVTRADPRTFGVTLKVNL